MLTVLSLPPIFAVLPRLCCLQTFCRVHSVSAEQEGCRYLSVSPTPLPPLVANGITVLPVKSSLSKKVLIIVGATYHQIGKPTKTVSYCAKSFTLPLIAGREDLSLISTELREFLSCQFKSAAVYGCAGVISYKSPLTTPASVCASFLVTPLHEK